MTPYQLKLKDSSIYNFESKMTRTVKEKHTIINNVGERVEKEDLFYRTFKNEYDTILQNSLVLNNSIKWNTTGKLINLKNADGSIEVGDRQLESNTVNLLGQFLNNDSPEEINKIIKPILRNYQLYSPTENVFDKYEYKNLDFYTKNLAGVTIIDNNAKNQKLITEDIKKEYSQRKKATSHARNFINELMKAYINTDYLLDTTLGIQLKVAAIGNIKVEYEKGGIYKYGKLDLPFKTLTSYWEDIEKKIITSANFKQGKNKITIESFTPIYPILKITAIQNARLKSLSIINETNKNQFLIEYDNVIETGETMIIDNNLGKITLGNNIINNILARGRFFMKLDPGKNELTVNIDHSSGFQLNLEYRNRYFI